MKKLLVGGFAALLAAAVFAQEMSLADARSKIADVVGNTSGMGEIMKALSADNQAAYLAEVNAAIAASPASPDEKAVKFLAVNEAAMKAQKGNLAALMAETYATVPPEALTVINERFAADLINRDADPANRMDDAKFTKVATDTMNTIQQRNAGNDNAGVRDTFAVLMFLRASNGSPADLRQTLVDNLPDAETRDLAENEWISPALKGDYDPILGAADAGESPDIVLVLRQSGPNMMAAMLADLAGDPAEKKTTASALSTREFGGLNLPEDFGLDRIPRSLDTDDKWYNAYRRGDSVSRSEPRPYPNQNPNAFN